MRYIRNFKENYKIFRIEHKSTLKICGMGKGLLEGICVLNAVGEVVVKIKESPGNEKMQILN